MNPFRRRLSVREQVVARITQHQALWFCLEHGYSIDDQTTANRLGFVKWLRITGRINEGVSQ